MPTFTADSIIKKTLIASKPVPVKRLPYDSAAVVYTVQPGQTVGNVHSYLLPKADRSTLYWMFYDANGRAYYTPHKIGMYSIKDLFDQGVLTVEQVTARETKANETTKDFIERMLKFGAIAFGIVILGKTFINKKVK